MEPEQVSQLLAEHRADMLAVAVGMMGWCPEAEDAVQDASLTAFSKIAQLRDPSHADAWLRTITRNVVRMHWRRLVSEIAWDPAQEPPLDYTTTRVPSPEEVIEQHQCRDWVWSEIDRLSPVLQMPVMLRYFTTVTSYQEIAAVCELPIGTVRSRLHQARSQLAMHLIPSAESGEPEDTADWRRRAASEASYMLRAADAGDIRSALPQLIHSDVLVTGPQGQRSQGRHLLALIMDSDQEAGVRQELVNAVSSRRVTVLESRLVNPAWDPDHCPPSVLWVLNRRDGRADRIRLFHPSRSS